MSTTPDSKNDTLAPGEASSIALASGYALDVRANAEQLVVRAPDGRVCLTIALGPDGPRVEIEAASLAIQANKLDLRSTGDIAMRAGGDLLLEAEGAIRTRAVEQHIEATLGDVHIEANDDVKLDGERIRLNSPDAPELRRLNRDPAVPDGAIPKGDG